MTLRQTQVRKLGWRGIFVAGWMFLTCECLLASGMWASRPLLAGKARLVEPAGFVVSRTLGSAAFAPEFMPIIELVYDSSVEKTGLFGRGWRSPQLESSLKWDKDGVLWFTPTGGRIKFYPAKDKSRNLEAHVSDWALEASSTDYVKARSFTIKGRYNKKGWQLVYVDGVLVEVTTPQGAMISVIYDAGRQPLAWVCEGVEFITFAYTSDGLIRSLSLNGVETTFNYEKEIIEILPKTIDGLPHKESVVFLSSLQAVEFELVSYKYKNGYLTMAAHGDFKEAFEVQIETAEDRKRNLLSKEKRNKVVHTGKIAGRILGDNEYRYSYNDKYTIEIKNKIGETATYTYDALNNIYTQCGFDGKTIKTFYHNRIDVAYTGKVRVITNGKNEELVRFRYDEKTGLIKRIDDKYSNKRRFTYDKEGNCIGVERKASVLNSGWESVRAWGYDRLGRITSIVELDENKDPVLTTSIGYDRKGRMNHLSDGERTLEILRTSFGFPKTVSDDISILATYTYDKYNRPIAAIDSFGIETHLIRNVGGQIVRVERRDGKDLLSYVDISYNKQGLPITVKDQNGHQIACDRDLLGRVVREKYANGTEVGYLYDVLGRLNKVIDENGNEITFDWNKFGLVSRRTAVNQLTEYNRDSEGRVERVVSSQNEKIDRVISRKYDKYGRLIQINYAAGETEIFTYDVWGRLVAHTRGERKATYKYDYFNRLTEWEEGSLIYHYTYDAHGRRTTLIISSPKGDVVAEKRSYDFRGRLATIQASGVLVRYAYNRKGQLVQQIVNGIPIDYLYTKRGQLAAKYFGGKKKPIATLCYEYAKDGRIISRTVDGEFQSYEYDERGQLLAVKDETGRELECYHYDKAGNILKKFVRGETTTYTYDAANQLVRSECGGIQTHYSYDAAGRLVQEGNKIFAYGYFDKVRFVKKDGDIYKYDYYVDGQLAEMTSSDSKETYVWDRLALVKRNDEQFVNEPHLGGGAVLSSSKEGLYFNDILGTTLGVKTKKGARRYRASTLTAFGAGDAAFFTGKPQVLGLGRAFLFRNYRPDLGKWQTADPLGYPDGWNQLAYCRNEVIQYLDFLGGTCTDACHCEGTCDCYILVYPSLFGDGKHYFMGREGMPIFNPQNEIMNFMEDNFPEAHYFAAVHDSWVNKIVDEWGMPDVLANIPTMPLAYVFGFLETSFNSFTDLINFIQDQIKLPDVDPIKLEYCSCE